MFIQYETSFHILLTDVQNNSVYLYIHKLLEICITQVALKSEGKNSAVVIHKLFMYNYHINMQQTMVFLKTGQFIGLWFKLLTSKQVILFCSGFFSLFILSDYKVKK